MGGRGAGSGGSIAKSNAIKKEMLEAAENSRFKGIARDAREGKGNYSFRNTTAVDQEKALQMTDVRFNEKNGNTLAWGELNGKPVFYANRSTDSTIQRLKDKVEEKRARYREDAKHRVDEIRTTTTYERWRKNNERNMESWFGKERVKKLRGK